MDNQVLGLSLRPQHGTDAEPEYVDPSDPISVWYWAQEFHLSEVDLLRAVKSAGTRVHMLRSLLGCHKPR